MIPIRNVTMLLFTGAVVAAHSLAQAQTAPDAKAIVDQSSAFARDLRTVYGDFISTTTDAQGQQRPMHTQVWAEPPDKMATRHTSPKGYSTFYVNGLQSTIYVQRTNTYMISQRVDPTITSDIMGLLDAGMGPGGSLADNDGKRQITFVGKEPVAGVACNHLRVVLPGSGSADVWIADGAQPLPVYIRMALTQPSPTNGETYMRWIVNKPIPPETFQFVPPPGAKKMDGRNQPVKKQ